MTLFLYVLRDFIKYVLGTLVLCVFLFLLFDFIHKTTKFIPRHEPETIDLVLFYVFQIPSLLIQALPIASLLSSVICMVLLSRTNEVTAMRASGMGPLRIGAPIACGGLLLSVFSIFLGEVVLPKSAKKGHYIEEVKIKRGSETQLAEGARWIRQDHILYNFKDFDPIANIMFGVKVIHTSDTFIPSKTIEAETAVYRPESEDWLLSNVKVLYFLPTGVIVYTEKVDFLPIQIPAEPKKLKKERRLPNELSLYELSEIIARGGTSGRDVLSYQVDMQIKLAFHFASFVVSLIGLKFGYKSERSIETAKGVLLAIALGVSYWFILNAGRALGKRGSLPPHISAWSANIILLMISWISVVRARKS